MLTIQKRGDDPDTTFYDPESDHIQKFRIQYKDFTDNDSWVWYNNAEWTNTGFNAD